VVSMNAWFVTWGLALGATACSRPDVTPVVWPPTPPSEVAAIPMHTWSARLLGGRLHTFNIRVVDKATGIAVPDAEVLYMPGTPSKGRLSVAERVYAERLWSGTLEAYYDRYGKIMRTDGEGRVSLKLAEFDRRFLARTSELRGELLVHGALPLPTESSDHEIALERPVSIVVQAVDTAGRPQPGMHLTVGFGDSGYAATYYADTPDARVRIYKPLEIVDDEALREVRIMPHVFGAPNEGILVDMLAFQAEPIQVVCPPTGQLLVESPSGISSTDYGSRLTLVSKTELQAGRVSYGRDMFAMGIALPNGRFLFPFVALDHEFTPMPLAPSTFARFPPAWQGGFKAQTIAGPRAAGETSLAKLQADLDAPVLSAVLLGPGGTPRADSLVHVEIGAMFGTSGYDKLFHVPTDRDGRFELLLPRYFDSVTPLSLLISIVNHAGEKVGPARHVPCSTFHLGERTELGNVTVLRPPHLVTLYMRGRDGLVKWGSPYFQVRQEPESGTASWVESQPAFSEELSNGGFAYYSHDPSKQWRVVFDHPLHKGRDPNAFAEPVEFRSGQDPLEVVQTGRYR
jgi:hypothetical protein